MPLDMRDEFLQRLVPVVMVPSHSDLAPPAANGHRYLAARDGFYMEVRRPWLHLVWPLAEAPTPLPYGPVTRAVTTSFGRIPAELLARFVEDATAALPNEAAAWIIWDELAGALAYMPCKAIEASAAGITLERPRLEAHQHLAIDLHSHGALPAFFSSQDDEDDAGEVKIAGVFGNLGGDQAPTAAFRLCAHGARIPMPSPRAYRRAEVE